MHIITLCRKPGRDFKKNFNLSSHPLIQYRKLKNEKKEHRHPVALVHKQTAKFKIKFVQTYSKQPRKRLF